MNMGMKPRAEYKPTCEVRLKRSDGYTSETKGLSYEAGLAISVVINRTTSGLPVKVVFDDEEVEA